MQKFIQYLDRRIEDGRAEIAALEAECRQDDANFAKVRANIYEICKTVTQTLLNRPGAGIGAIRAQLDRFQSLWGASLLKAKEHEDAGRIAVEEIKLAALEEVILHFREATDS